jgi:23S rRNA (adenine2503-C2)-methyltransferase
MGMGEPLLNSANVVAAIHCLNQDVGISQRSITLSTVGLPGQIAKLSGGPAAGDPGGQPACL